jgi:hypothetical protein
LELLEGMFSMNKVVTRHFNPRSGIIRAGLRQMEGLEANAAPANRENLAGVIRTALSDPRPLIPATDLIRRRQRK